MKISVPKEIKNHEYRVGLTPESVRECTHHGHDVYVQSGAGEGIGSTDAEYISAGATITPDAETTYAEGSLVIKVKEPQHSECVLLREDHILFSYLHLAPDPEQTRDLIASKAICIAYETVTSPEGGLPLLAPMSKVAGRMAVQAGAYCLEHPHGGLGMLLGGVPGVDPAKVVIIGGGVVGTHAAHIAVGMGADVWIIDRNMSVIEKHWQQFGRSTNTVFSTQHALERHVLEADLVIGSVLIPGAAAPKLVSKEMVKAMKSGSVIIDVAIDQGGCFETSRPTTHAEPTYIVDDVVHYCVTNMPGGVPRTSTFALNNATLPHILTLADKGWKKALLEDEHLMAGLNICQGHVTNQPVASSLGYNYHNPKDILRTK
ncbi:MAG TPA: alanine dehydrogenase [Gammaproteobacteria bacterium]|nr:alanine dehydrogenase [Gammaproteobacteria bacterium]